MVKPIVDFPRPFADEGDVDAELGPLFRAVPEPRPLPASVLAEVRDRLGVSRYPSSIRQRARELVLAATMLVAGSSIALAGWGANQWWRARAQPSSAPSARPPATVQAAPRVARTAGAERPAPQATAIAMAANNETSESVVAPKTANGGALEHRGATPAPAGSSTLSAEARALEVVLVKLRREHDARGALALLDESQALFARGTLSLEAEVARLDALLQLGRRAEALRILEHLPFAQVGRGGELRVVRAELRAVDDCGRALADFDVLVNQPLPSPLLERAIYGRAACELQVGDRSQAAHDFKRYLTRFPQGRFAARVQSQLAQLPAEIPRP